MTRVVLDGELLDRLKGVTQKVELVDGTGRLVGVFEPTSDPAKPRVVVPLSEDEIRRRLQSTVRKPLSEILKGLPES